MPNKMRILPFSSVLTNFSASDNAQTYRTVSSFIGLGSISKENSVRVHRSYPNEGHFGCVTSATVLGWTRSRRPYSTEVIGNQEKNYYKILGVTPNCSKSRIKVAYYKLSKIYHPDVNKTEEAKVKFQDISEAYDVLSNALTRQKYDKDRASFSPGYRSNARHGQEKYRPRNIIYPMGRSSTYNFDAWHDKHYQSSLSDAIKQKKLRESRQASEVTAEVKQRMTQNDVKDPSFAPAIGLIAFFSLIGLSYLFVQNKLDAIQNKVNIGEKESKPKTQS